jgi:serralysin
LRTRPAASGADTIRDNVANNTINGAGGTDTVIFSGLRSAYQLTDLGSGNVKVVGPDGTDTLISVERLQFDDQTMTWPPPGAPSWSPHDFNSDGHPDILWQNDNGSASIWTLGGTNFTAGIPLGNDPGPTWHIKDTADFNSDGHPDILWQNNNGSASIWTLGGTNFTAGIPLGNDPGPTWHIKDTADFNSDGHPDILWQNDSGAASIWTLGGTNLTAGIPLGNDPGPTWHIMDIADFNRDGHPDILWQNDSGAASIWTLGGTNPYGRNSARQ